MTKAPKFYLFDVGLVNHFLHRKEVVRGTPEYGHAFEHFVIQEIVAYIHYYQKPQKLSYWHTSTGLEVDAVIGDEVAIEIKSTEDVQNKHLKGLRAFCEEHSGFRLIIVALDTMTRKTEEDIEIIYIYDFLRMLWVGDIF